MGELKKEHLARGGMLFYQKYEMCVKLFQADQ